MQLTNIGLSSLVSSIPDHRLWKGSLVSDCQYLIYLYIVEQMQYNGKSGYPVSIHWEEF